MEVVISCHFCFEKFSINIELFDGSNSEIWDCEICCNPNKVDYSFINDSLVRLDISDGNE